MHDVLQGLNAMTWYRTIHMYSSDLFLYITLICNYIFLNRPMQEKQINFYIYVYIIKFVSKLIKKDKFCYLFIKDVFVNTHKFLIVNDFIITDALILKELLFIFCLIFRMYCCKTIMIKCNSM